MPRSARPAFFGHTLQSALRVCFICTSVSQKPEAVRSKRLKPIFCPGNFRAVPIPEFLSEKWHFARHFSQDLRARQGRKVCQQIGCAAVIYIELLDAPQHGQSLFCFPQAQQALCAQKTCANLLPLGKVLLKEQQRWERCGKVVDLWRLALQALGIFRNLTE